MSHTSYQDIVCQAIVYQDTGFPIHECISIGFPVLGHWVSGQGVCISDRFANSSVRDYMRMQDVLSGGVYQETEFPVLDIRIVYVLVVLGVLIRTLGFQSCVYMYVSCPGLYINRCHVRTPRLYQNTSHLVRVCISEH